MIVHELIRGKKKLCNTEFNQKYFLSFIPFVATLDLNILVLAIIAVLTESVAFGYMGVSLKRNLRGQETQVVRQ